MHIVTGIVGFGVGYAAGMRMGDRPIRAVRSTAMQARERAASLSTTAGRIRSSISAGAGGATGEAGPTGQAATGATGQTVDVRQVREVMTAAPETVTPETPIREAAALMERADIGNVLVVENEELRGIVTDRDITVRAVAQGMDPGTSVREVFTASAVSISPLATVQEAAELMRQHDVRRIPVVESGVPIGIVSLGDLAVSHDAGSLLADISAASPNN